MNVNNRETENKVTKIMKFFFESLRRLLKLYGEYSRKEKWIKHFM